VIVNTAQLRFGRRLQGERERRGLTLQAIADRTKIPRSLLAALERGDIADWPGGLFGRAHIRAYAAAVGVSSEPLMIEFLHLIDTAPAPTPVVDGPADDGGPRLALAEDRGRRIRSIGTRVLASALDLCGIVTIATVIALILQTDLSLACALVSLIYGALATTVLGQSVTLWYLGGRVLQRTSRSTANVRTPVFLVPLRSLRTSRPQQSPIAFRENSSASVAQAAPH
jgi:transcriptional regulator with XRE-family HTH domain